MAGTSGSTFGPLGGNSASAFGFGALGSAGSKPAPSFFPALSGEGAAAVSGELVNKVFHVSLHRCPGLGQSQ